VGAKQAQILEDTEETYHLSEVHHEAVEETGTGWIALWILEHLLDKHALLHVDQSMDIVRSQNLTHLYTSLIEESPTGIEL
jgi:hypothetical protein